MSSGKQATWGGRFSEPPAELMQRFGESVSFDARLALFDIRASQAHASMLCHVGLIDTAERDAICAGLDAIGGEVLEGKFSWDTALEDVHMNIEQALTQRCPAAAKLHTARSRNDQIATDMRLYIRAACEELHGVVRELMRVLVGRAEATRAVLIPGYTHLQRAQPVSMAHHFLAYVEMLERDRQRFRAVRQRANVCPLGSGALAGSTLPIDRAFTARQLGFVDGNGEPRITQNGLDAVADRDYLIDFLSACATCATHLSRLAEDLILWNSSEFGFVRLPDAFTTGSSLMPQKKNPDSLELIRGKAARIQAHLPMLLTLCKGLPLTYNRDLQEDKPPVFDAHDQLVQCLKVAAGTLAGAEARPERCAQAVADPLLLATDLADYLVEKGVPFREAHHAVGALVAEAEKAQVPLDQLSLETAQRVHSAIGKDWTEVFDLERAMRRRERPGMPGPKQVAERIDYWRGELGEG